MVIQGLPFENGGLKKISENHISGASNLKNPVSETSIADTGTGYIQDHFEVSYTVPMEFPVRENMVQSVSDRLSRNTYITSELMGKVAEQLLNSSGVYETLTGTAISENSMGGRTDKIDLAHDHQETGVYERPETMKDIAEKILQNIMHSE